MQSQTVDVGGTQYNLQEAGALRKEVSLSMAPTSLVWARTTLQAMDSFQSSRRPGWASEKSMEFLLLASQGTANQQGPKVIKKKQTCRDQRLGLGHTSLKEWNDGKAFEWTPWMDQSVNLVRQGVLDLKTGWENTFQCHRKMATFIIPDIMQAKNTDVFKACLCIIMKDYSTTGYYDDV